MGIKLNYTGVDTPLKKKRRGIDDIFGGNVDPAFQFQGPGGAPSLSDDKNLFDEMANQGEAFRRQEEDRSFNNILENLQDRGLAKSGVPIRQAMESIVGPSAARASNLASTFGISEALRGSELNENARNADRALNQQMLTGAQGVIKGDMDNSDQYDISRMMYDLEMEKLRNSGKNKSKSLRGALGGAIGSGLGAYLGSFLGPAGTTAGAQVGGPTLSRLFGAEEYA